MATKATVFKTIVKRKERSGTYYKRKRNIYMVGKRSGRKKAKMSATLTEENKKELGTKMAYETWLSAKHRAMIMLFLTVDPSGSYLLSFTICLFVIRQFG